MDLVLSAVDIDQLGVNLEGAEPSEIIRAAAQRIANITFACSFGAEDMVLLDIIAKTGLDIPVFYLDTDLLFGETYVLRDIAQERYPGVRFVRVAAQLTLEEQAQQHGEALWESKPDLCCALRKVQPLEEHLKGCDGWITGIRRQQSPTRANAAVFESDARFGLVKVNPLVTWTDDQVWEYIKEHDVPYNPLHDHGYPSIGCAPCTRSVAPGEDPRSGRWAGFTKTECGLHK